MTHGNQMNIADTAMAAVQPRPRVVTSRLLSTDEQAVFAWVTLNEAALVAYWDGLIDTRLGSQLQCPPQHDFLAMSGD